MDEFLYKVELNRINDTTSGPQLIKDMSEYSNALVYLGHRYIRFVHRDVASKIVSINWRYLTDFNLKTEALYRHQLYIDARQRYFDLGLPLNKLPKYVTWEVQHIDINKTIQSIKDNPCIQ